MAEKVRFRFNEINWAFDIKPGMFYEIRESVQRFTGKKIRILIDGEPITGGTSYNSVIDKTLSVVESGSTA